MHTICTCECSTYCKSDVMHRARRFYETNSTILWSLVMAIVPEFCFTLISFHHQCHEKKRQQIPNLYLVFFSLFLFSIFIFGDAIFYEPTFFFPSVPFNSFGWVVKFCMCNFFVASVLSRFLRQQMTFVSLHAIFSNVFLLSCFHLKIPLSIHLNHIATSLNVFKQRLTRKIAQHP